MPPSLSSLPAELIERIVYYLPRGKTLKSLRRTNRELAVKTSACFARAFTASYWGINRRTIKALQFLSSSSMLHEQVTTIVLKSRFVYFFAIEGVDATKFAGALSQFRNLTDLTVQNFMVTQSRSFFHDFAGGLHLEKLNHLDLDKVDMNDDDAVLIITRHKTTLTSFTCTSLNLFSNRGDKPYRPPWANLLRAIRKLEKDCHLTILDPYESGREEPLKQEDGHGEEDDYEYAGLFIGVSVDEDDAKRRSTRIYTVERDAQWRKGVQHLENLYLDRCFLQYWYYEEEAGSDSN